MTLDYIGQLERLLLSGHGIADAAALELIADLRAAREALRDSAMHVHYREHRGAFATCDMPSCRRAS